MGDSAPLRPIGMIYLAPSMLRPLINYINSGYKCEKLLHDVYVVFPLINTLMDFHSFFIMTFVNL